MEKLCKTCNITKDFLLFHYNKCDECRLLGKNKECDKQKRKEINRLYYMKKSVLSPETYYTKKIKKIV